MLINLLKLVLLSHTILTFSERGVFVQCVSVYQDLTFSQNERMLLDRFRGEVAPLLPEPYMLEDIYLIRWLRASNLNLEEAKAMLLENLRWRKANNMSTIHQEDWSDMEEDYKFFADTFDKEGRPIVDLRFGDWDIRKAVLTSQGPRLNRYLYKVLDEVTAKVRALQQQGKMITQWVNLLDMDGYGFVTHGCVQCMGIYINYVQTYEAYFPGSVHNIILVNTPFIFETVLRVTRPLMREETKNILQVYGTNKRQWQTFLLQHIDANMLETSYGGNKIRSLHH